jgi:hypothetical protein
VVRVDGTVGGLKCECEWAEEAQGWNNNGATKNLQRVP